MNMPVRYAMLVAAVALSSAACSNARHNGPNPTDAVVTGDFVRVGGPSPGAAVPLDGRVEFISNARTVTVKVAKDGKFVAHLPAGHYALKGTSPHIGGGSVSCSAPSELTVVAGESAQQRIICHIP